MREATSLTLTWFVASGANGLVITKYFPDNRRVLNELQRYAAGGTIDKGILASVANIQVTELINSIKSKDFAETRKWVTQNLDNDPARIFRNLYDNMFETSVEVYYKKMYNQYYLMMLILHQLGSI